MLQDIVILCVGHPARKESILEPTLKGAMALALNATGPVSPHLPAFVTFLIEQRYAVVCVRAKAWRAAAFDGWLTKQGIELAEIKAIHVDEFLRREYRPRSDCRAAPRSHEPADVRHLIGYLREQGLCEPEMKLILPADKLVSCFEQFLLRERGLAATTIDGYRTHARCFLVHRFGNETADLGVLRAADVIDFVQSRSRQLTAKALKNVIAALRAFLRYAHYCGDIGPELIYAVPAVAAWATTPPLPRAISAEHASQAIESCDQNTAVGRRDRAILLLLARLGLRGGEVLTLSLDDVEWDTGRLSVRGKNGRQCSMPLPADVGEAIAAYLQNGRPNSLDRHLFLRTRAPFRSLQHGSDGVGSIVRNSLERAGIASPHKGAHQFRHALAVQMLRNGGSLQEIGEVLRHRSQKATSIYAKVDLMALLPLALPWPGSAS